MSTLERYVRGVFPGARTRREFHFVRLEGSDEMPGNVLGKPGVPTNNLKRVLDSVTHPPRLLYQLLYVALTEMTMADAVTSLNI